LIVLLILGLVSAVLAVIAACSSTRTRNEAVGSSANLEVVSQVSYQEDSSTMSNAWNVQVADGLYINSSDAGKNRVVTLFEGKFNGDAGVGWTSRDRGSAMGSLNQITTTSWGNPTLIDDAGVSTYKGPAAIQYVQLGSEAGTGNDPNTQGQWIAAVTAQNTETFSTGCSGGCTVSDVVMAVSNDQGSTWVNPVSLQMLLSNQQQAGETGIGQPNLGGIGTIVIAVDPGLTYFQGTGPSEIFYSGYTSNYSLATG
jgi:type II secretory pathway pseudopilin PulG